MSEDYIRPPAAAGQVKLDLNEAPWEADQTFRQRFFQLLDGVEFRRYPPFDARPAREAAARLYGWEVDGTLVGNGSNELLFYALSVLCQSGKKVLALSPSFSVYPWLVRRTGGELSTLCLPPPDFLIPEEALLAKAGEADVLLLCSPNNPTGNELTPDLWHRLLSLGKPTIWDGAYWEFGTGGEVRPWLSRYPNLLITRTLSKVWGVAGVRVGCLLTSPVFASRLRRALLPFAPGLAVWAAFAAASSLIHLGQERAARIVAARDTQIAALAEIPGVEVVPSRGNFFLFRCPPLTGKELAELLGEKGVSVRLVEELVQDGFVRITVGTPRENERCRKALEEVMDVVASRKG